VEELRRLQSSPMANWVASPPSDIALRIFSLQLTSGCNPDLAVRRCGKWFMYSVNGSKN
jgi:hypothetical protein